MFVGCEDGRMTAFWVVIGALALAVPHVATVGTDGAMAWGGLPFPAECAGVLLAVACFYLVGIPRRLREALEPATLACIAAMLVVELVGVFLGEGSQGGLAWGFVDEAIHAAAAVLWLALAAAKRREAAEEDKASNALVVALLFLGGATWYLTTAALRYALPHWKSEHETLLWACALLWAAPLATLLRAASCTKKTFVARAFAPVLGVLVANRAWMMALGFGFGAPRVGSLAGALLAAPVLSVAALAIAWVNEKPDKEDAPIVESAQAQSASQASCLPLHLVSGYDALSDRERAVLLKTLDGASATAIGAELGISDATARTYRARAYEKMNVSGSAELFAILRAAIERPAPTLDGDAQTPGVRAGDAQTPGTQVPNSLLKPLMRMKPQLACVLAALAAVAVLLVCRNVSAHASALVLCIVCFGCFAVGFAKLGARAESASPEAVIMAASLGAGVALALAALAFGPGAYVARRAILSAAAFIAALWLAHRERAFWGTAPYLALAAFGLVGAALIPCGARVQALVHSTLPFFLVAACLVLAAFALKELVNDAEALVAELTLKGDERVLAYLQGRGISDIMAQVALLTARDFPASGIAATLHISGSTVAKYRMRAYKTLGVSNKEELTKLLEREAGLVGGGWHDE